MTQLEVYGQIKIVYPLSCQIYRNSTAQNKTVVYIQVSSVSLASEDPVDEDSHRNYYLGIADYFFTGTALYFTILYCTVLFCTVLHIYMESKNEYFFSLTGPENL